MENAAVFGLTRALEHVLLLLERKGSLTADEVDGALKKALDELNNKLGESRLATVEAATRPVEDLLARHEVRKAEPAPQ